MKLQIYDFFYYYKYYFKISYTFLTLLILNQVPFAALCRRGNRVVTGFWGTSICPVSLFPIRFVFLFHEKTKEQLETESRKDGRKRCLHPPRGEVEQKKKASAKRGSLPCIIKPLREFAIRDSPWGSRR